jgi:diguanylate cyclase (GGDEF)-like protein
MSQNSQYSPDGEPPPAGFGWSLLVNSADLLSTGNHDSDFSGSRAAFITIRVRILSLIYALLALIWIAIDYLTITGDVFSQVVIARLLLVSGFLLLALWPRRLQSTRYARGRLLALVLLPCLFYIATRLQLNGTVDEAIQMAYALYPFVIVAQLAVFPLTLLEGVLLTLPTLASVGLTEYLLGSLWTMDALGQFWLLLLLIALSLWAEMSQLQMLLRLYRQATRDPLTGLFNRRMLLERLAVEVERARRYQRDLSVLLFDLDLFKRINDRHGHLVGDLVLCRFVALVGENMRSSDLAGRYGGEEFLAILPETSLEAAQDVAERIRGACHAAGVTNGSGAAVPFTTSIGVAQMAGREDETQLLERADQALYAAKAAGRDKVQVGGRVSP